MPYWQGFVYTPYLADQGVEVPLVTGAGTGSFMLEGASGVYDEVQPGRLCVVLRFRESLGSGGLVEGCRFRTRV